MKRLTLLLTILSAALGLMAQSPCGHNHMILKDVEADSTFAQRILPGITYSRSSFEQKTIPVIVHIFHEGEEYGEGSHLTQEIVIEAIDHLNQTFSGLTEDNNDTFIDFCISNETLTGSQAFGILYHDLNDYEEYDGSLGNVIDNDLYVGLQNTYDYSVTNYLEIFVAPWTSGFLGFTSVPPSNLGVWIRTSKFGFGEHIINTSGQNTTLVHEVGHWCGLYHTFANGFSSYQSCEDAQQETNCETQGDYVCDTEPTAATGGCTNDCGNDTENIMSYHPGTCRTGFTMGQIERMHERIEVHRLQHIENNFCDGTETGCIDAEACNFNEIALYDDGSCEYADPGFDCEGNLITSINEIIDYTNIESIICYTITGKEIELDKITQSGVYIMHLKHTSGKFKISKIYITR